MKNFIKSILSIAAVIAVLGAAWMYISKKISADDLEDEFDDGFEDYDDFEDEEDDDLFLRKVPKPLKVVNDSDYDSDDED